MRRNGLVGNKANVCPAGARKLSQGLPWEQASVRMRPEGAGILALPVR
jgi:hypothetical protein